MNLNLLLCVLICGYSGAAGGPAAAVTVDLTRRRAIGGVSRLRRGAYFNIHGQLKELSRKEADVLVGDLGASFGRNVGFTTWMMGRLREDPARRGRVDAAHLMRGGKELLAGRGPNESAETRPASDPVYTSHPHAFYPTGAKRAAAKGFVPGGHEAVAEYLALLFRHCLASPPRYYEVMNEPNVKARELKTTWDDMCELHAIVARGLRREFPEMLVGGPTLAWPAFEKREFRIWNAGMKKFIDTVGREMDFFSLHLYDTHYDDRVFVRTGANVEAILDLVENYALLRTGEVKPLVISEYGAGFKKGHAVRGAYTPLRDWHILQGVTGKLMSLLDRPDRVLKSIPFIVVRAGWYKSEHPYPWVLYHRSKGHESKEKEGGWTPTHLVKLYRLWKDVRGERAVVRSTDADVQAHAFVDGATAYLCLNSLEADEVEVKVGVLLGPGVRVETTAASRLYSDGEKPVLEEAPPAPGPPGRMRLRPGETVIVRLGLSRAPRWRSFVDERSSYGGRTVVPIGDGPVLLDVPLPDPGETGGTPAYARLRVSVGRPPGLSLTPAVSLNGAALAVPEDDEGPGRNRGEDHLGAKEIDVPVALLRARGATNEVRVRFPDAGGHVSSVVLVVGYEREAE